MCGKQRATSKCSDFPHIKISDELDVDPCATFLTFQHSPRSHCHVNVITLQELYTSCNFTGMFSTAKSQMGLMLTLSDLF